MHITIYKDGGFSFEFSEEERQLGAEILGLILPANKESAEYLGKAQRYLLLGENPNKTTDETTTGNVVPFKPKPH